MAVSPPDTPSLTVDIVRWSRTHQVALDDAVVTEEPLEIRVRAGTGSAYATLAITMRTPGHDVELALGFLYGEGLLVARGDVLEAQICTTTSNVVNVTVRPDLDLRAKTESRRFYTTSSCGLCGRSSLDAVAAALKGRRVAGDRPVSTDTLTALPVLLRGRQTVFHATGGLHGCGLFTAGGELVAVREDVGRHNAVDKLVGRSFLDGTLPGTDRILMLSGRAGFELVQKAVMAGISVVAAVGAPTSLAVELARTAGQTLVGFVTPERLNVYAGGHRLGLDGPAGRA